MAYTPTGTIDTVADAVQQTRVLLQDQVIPYRYPDLDVITAYNLALMEAYRLRPDIFYHNPGWTDEDEGVPEETLPSSGVATDDINAIPIESQFRMAFCFGITAYALMRDQEDVQDARASMFMGMFTQMLVGAVLPAPSIRPGGK